MKTREVVAQHQRSNYGFEVRGVTVTTGHEGEALRSGSIYYQGAYVGKIAEDDWGAGLDYTITNTQADAVFKQVTGDLLLGIKFMGNLLTDVELKESIEEFKEENSNFTGELFCVQYHSLYARYNIEKVVGYSVITFNNIQEILKGIDSEAYEHAHSITIAELDTDGQVHKTTFFY